MELLFCAWRAKVAAALAVAGMLAGTVLAGEAESTLGKSAPTNEGSGISLEVKVTGPQKAKVGSQVTFELSVTNTGKTAATKLLMVDDFDPGLVHAAAASPIEHDLKDLRPGESQRLGVTFRVTRPGKQTHQVQILREGKTIATANSSVVVAADEASAATEKTAPVEPKGKADPANPQPPKADAKKMQKEPGGGKDPDLEFTEIKPRDDAPKEDKAPDLGPPLVDKPEDLKALNEKYPVWIDRKQGCVVLVGVVCQQQVPLELFACVRGSKEHEAALSIPTKAAFVHAALLAVGAEPGSPVQFRPKYVPANGSEIEITCIWKDAQGKRHTARAQDWVRNVKTGKSLEYPWVFGGSRFQKNPVTGEMYYQADADGDLICVSNFPGAMLDLPIQSTSSDADLLFEGFAERIPPRGTPVTVILTPKIKEPAKARGNDSPAPKPPAKPSPPSEAKKPEGKK